MLEVGKICGPGRVMPAAEVAKIASRLSDPHGSTGGGLTHLCGMVPEKSVQRDRAV